MADARAYLTLSHRQKANKQVNARITFLKSKKEGNLGICRHTLTNVKVTTFCIGDTCLKEGLSLVEQLTKQKYSEPCQTSKIDRFAKKIIERSILDVGRFLNKLLRNILSFRYFILFW